jgi:hypothetical protein
VRLVARYKARSAERWSEVHREPRPVRLSVQQTAQRKAALPAQLKASLLEQHHRKSKTAVQREGGSLVK